jgi:tripartite-type tricarboxylate transporter receptor subunit TctC
MCLTGGRIARRQALLAAGGMLAAPRIAGAQAFPARPVRIVVPFTPGGSTDTPTRLIAAEMQKTLGQPIVVENRPGAAGAIGMEYVARSAPDGYTWGLGGVGNLVVLPKLNTRLGYAPSRDLAYAAFMNVLEFVLVARPGLEVRSVADVVALAKANPGRLTYGSAGRASSYQLSFEAFKLRAGVDILEVPFQGDAPLLNEMMGGRVDLAIAALSSVQALVAAGQLRLIGTGGAQRGASTPDTPTIAEQGFPGYVARSWSVLAAPIGTPDAVCQAVNDAARAATSVPEVRQRLAATGMSTEQMDLAQVRAFVAAETADFTTLIDRIGLRPD